MVPVLLAATTRIAAADEPHALRHTGDWFLAGELGGSAAMMALALAFHDPPATCRWCQPNDLDRSVRDALVVDPDYRRTAGAWSHVLSIGAAGALALSSATVPAVTSGHGRYALQDSAIILSAFSLTTAVGTVTKQAAGRRRPAFTMGEQHQTEFGDYPGQQNLSFFSVDTAWAFSLGASAATLAFLRGYREAPYVVVAGALIGIGTGLLRVASDVHWTTDVITGALVGTGIGVALPLALHRRETGSETGVAAQPLGAGTYGLALSGAF